MKLSLDQILAKPRAQNRAIKIHPGTPHQYECIKTPNGHDMYICSLPKCSHSLNISRWIVGKENLCSMCNKSYIIGEERSLICDNCVLLELVK